MRIQALILPHWSFSLSARSMNDLGIPLTGFLRRIGKEFLTSVPMEGERIQLAARRLGTRRWTSSRRLPRRD
ncbi:hypothetical protein BO71DRAFT_397086 [Aspergillus ellipticus CBS 707.79]|uniref:Uncharacterized protein n=1 Tax=Aspergillus ellipticus CBS 707.79 TaxID=1448320 RepID=A0A319DHG5_9EURO|nr:hypothetical protein BO71DRAFT_397086 [Aspergillus ellipticus CBS 707.79]